MAKKPKDSQAAVRRRFRRHSGRPRFDPKPPKEPKKPREPRDELFARLSADLREASRTLSVDEARYLVDSYYIMQESRKRANNQIRSMTIEPTAVITWVAQASQRIEDEIKLSLDIFSDNSDVGVWIKGHYGLGPVIAAGLVAHIDIEQAPTVGHIWSYAGLDPQKKWEKGEKRPWNASLKTLCWKIGQSFMKFSGDERCVYGHLYKKQKAKYVAINDADGYKARAAEILTIKKWKKNTEAYKHLSNGKLPPAQIDAMARRWAVKLFLAHLHGWWFEYHFHKPPPLPYPIAILGHAHMIEHQPNSAREPNGQSEPKSLKASSEKSEPQSRKEPASESEPGAQKAPREKSEPPAAKEPHDRSEPPPPS